MTLELRQIGWYVAEIRSCWWCSAGENAHQVRELPGI